MKPFKKVILVIICLLGGITMSYAQLSKEQIKERKAISKYSKSELTAKASKIARKEAKKLAKQGWQIAPGAVPIEKQLDKSYMMQYEYEEDLFPKYIMAEAMSVGVRIQVVQTISAAKNLISQSIGRTIPVVEVYRTLSNKNKEVLVRLAYSQEMAKAAAKKAIREDLEKKGEELHNKLEKLLGW